MSKLPFFSFSLMQVAQLVLFFLSFCRSRRRRSFPGSSEPRAVAAGWIAESHDGRKKKRQEGAKGEKEREHLVEREG